MIKVDNSMFGGAQNAAHFEKNGTSICMPTDVFWQAVRGDTQIARNSAETTLAAEVAECMSEVMPIVMDKKYEVRPDDRGMFYELSVVARTMLDNYNTCMIDDMLFFCLPPEKAYFGLVCLRSKLAIALAKGERGSSVIYANSPDYILMFDSIIEFNEEMLDISK